MLCPWYGSKCKSRTKPRFLRVFHVRWIGFFHPPATSWFMFTSCVYIYILYIHIYYTYIYIYIIHIYIYVYIYNILYIYIHYIYIYIHHKSMLLELQSNINLHRPSTINSIFLWFHPWCNPHIFNRNFQWGLIAKSGIHLENLHICIYSPYNPHIKIMNYMGIDTNMNEFTPFFLCVSHIFSNNWFNLQV